MKQPFVADNASMIDRCYAFFSFCPANKTPRARLCERLVKEFGWCEFERGRRHLAVHPDFVEVYRHGEPPLLNCERKQGLAAKEMLSPTERKLLERREKTRQLADVIYRMVRGNPFGKPRSTR